MANQTHDADRDKGAVEQDRPSQPTNTSMDAQLPHRTENPDIKGRDTDFPEPGGAPEHSGESRADTQVNPEGETQDQDPGQRQKENQGGKKDDPLAA